MPTWRFAWARRDGLLGHGPLCCELFGTVFPCLLLRIPVLVPPFVGFEHPEGKDIWDIVGVPPSAWDLQAHLNDMTMGALDFAAGEGPLLVTIISVINPILTTRSALPQLKQ